MHLRQSRLAILLIATTLAPAVPSFGLALDTLQALPGHSPPYIFRVALTSTSQTVADSPAVLVRQPHDAIAVIKQHDLELRLRALTDVEIEISQGGDTINRLLLKSEFEAARRHLESAALVRRRQLAPLPDTPMPVVEVRSSPRTSATLTGAERSEIEREMRQIRGEIHTLMQQVTPWQGLTTPGKPAGAEAIKPGTSLTLWGGSLGVVAILLTGGLLHRHASLRQRHRQHARAISKRGCRRQLWRRHATVRTPLAVQREGWEGSVTVLRRLRVSRKTRRRLRLRVVQPTSRPVLTGVASALQLLDQRPRPTPDACAQALVLLEQLRRQLGSR